MQVNIPFNKRLLFVCITFILCIIIYRIKALNSIYIKSSLWGILRKNIHKQSLNPELRRLLYWKICHQLFARKLFFWLIRASTFSLYLWLFCQRSPAISINMVFIFTGFLPQILILILNVWVTSVNERTTTGLSFLWDVISWVSRDTHASSVRGMTDAI